MDLDYYIPVMRGSRNLCQRGSNFDNVFLVDERRDDQNSNAKRAIIDLPAKRQLNGVSLASLRWPNIEFWPSSFEIFQGIRTSITKKTVFFLSFRGVRTNCSPPSGSAHASQEIFSHFRTFPGFNQYLIG